MLNSIIMIFKIIKKIMINKFVRIRILKKKIIILLQNYYIHTYLIKMHNKNKKKKIKKKILKKNKRKKISLKIILCN